MAANQTGTIHGQIAPRYMQQLPEAQRKEVFGLSFPLGSSKGGGFFAKQSGIRMIKNSVKQLLLTEKGERLMLPNFGCNLRKYLFQPLDEQLFESIKREIQYSFSNYIVGAKIAKIAVFPSGEEGSSGGNTLSVVLSLKLDTDDLQVFDVEVNIS